MLAHIFLIYVAYHYTQRKDVVQCVVVIYLLSVAVTERHH